MIINSYFVRARLFPTLLTALPILGLVNYLFLHQFYYDLKNIFDVLPILSNLGLSTAVIFLSVQVNRLSSKELFQKYFFKEELEMPTTNHLLWHDNFFDNSTKESIRSKILSKFSIALLSNEEEQKNEKLARKRIVTAVSQIRILLKNNELLLQHNIEYGFFRNLLGGCTVAVLISLILIVLGSTYNIRGIFISGIAFFIIYSIPILISKYLVNKFGTYYSKILYEQFLGA